MTTPSKFRAFYMGKNAEARKDYANKVEFETSYIECHLVSQPPRKTPPLRKLVLMAEASGGELTLQDVIRHFTPQEPAPADATTQA